MDVVYGLIPMVLIFGFIMVVIFIWAAKKGQFDDLDGAANSIFMDDEFLEEAPKGSAEKKSGERQQSDASQLSKEKD